MAIINEHWRNASESVEVISFPDGNLTVFIKNSEAIIFESLFDFFQYQSGMANIKRIYCKESELSEIYDNSKSFYTIDKIHKVVN